MTKKEKDELLAKEKAEAERIAKEKAEAEAQKSEDVQGDPVVEAKPQVEILLLKGTFKHKGKEYKANANVPIKVDEDIANQLVERRVAVLYKTK